KKGGNPGSPGEGTEAPCWKFLRGRRSGRYPLWRGDESLPPAPFGVGILLLAQRQPNRRTRQIKRFAQTVDEVPPVSVRQGIGTAGEQHKAWRPALGLGDVVQPDSAAGRRRRRVRGSDLAQPAIERARRHAPVPDRMRPDDRLPPPVGPLARQARNGNDRYPV